MDGPIGESANIDIYMPCTTELSIAGLNFAIESMYF